MNKLALALILSPAALFCADDALPKPEVVLERWIEATGGRAALMKRHNQIQHGTMEFIGRGVKGTITLYEAEPNKNLVVVELPGLGKIESGSNGDVFWENSAMQGPRIKQGLEKTDAIRDSTFNAALYWKTLYAKVETAGAETVAGHDCYKVVLTPKEGPPVTEFFDKKSGLLVKTQTVRTSPMGEITAEILYEDYRKEGDLLAPHKLINHAAGQEFQIVVQSTEINVDMRKDQFDPPAEIQALLRKSDQPAAVKPTVAVSPASGNAGKLNVFMGGKPMATENYTVTKSAGKIEISGSGNAAIGPMKIDIDQFKVVTNDKFQLIEAAAKAKLGQVQMNVKTTFADGKAKNEIDSGQGPNVKEDAVQSGAVVVNANLPLYPWSFLMLQADLKTQDPQQFPVYVLGQSEVPATVVFKGREPVAFATKTVELNHLNVSGKTPQGQPISLDFWIDDDRRVIKILVPAQGVEAYQEGYDRKAPPEIPKGDAAKGDGKG